MQPNLQYHAGMQAFAVLGRWCASTELCMSVYKSSEAHQV